MADEIPKVDNCSGRCPICQHPDRKRIEADFLAGITCSEIETRYSNGNGTFEHRTVDAHCYRSGLVKKYLDDTERFTMRVINRIDPSRPATFTEAIAAMTRRDKVLGRYGDNDSKQGLLTGTTVENLQINIGNMSQEDRTKLIEAKELIEGKGDSETE